MSKFNKSIQAEQFFISGNPEEYPEGVEWSRERGCYTVGGAPIADEDWIVTERYPVKPDVFMAMHEPIK